jgi:hypothetical protein
MIIMIMITISNDIFPLTSALKVQNVRLTNVLQLTTSAVVLSSSSIARARDRGMKHRREVRARDEAIGVQIDIVYVNRYLEKGATSCLAIYINRRGVALFKGRHSGNYIRKLMEGG